MVRVHGDFVGSVPVPLWESAHFRYVSLCFSGVLDNEASNVSPSMSMFRLRL